MPFTSAHIAAVIPFKKYTPHLFSISGLVIGSMVPDFEYFVRMTLYGHYGHTLSGIFFFDIPLGLLLYVIFHSLVRVSTIEHLPQYFYCRAANALSFGWKKYFYSNFFQIILSIFVGVLTHFIWDGFTHDEEYYVASYFTFLLKNVSIFGKITPLHYVFQILSTFVGMAILIVHIHFLPKIKLSNTKSNTEILNFWFCVLVLAVIIGAIRWAIGMPNEKIMGQLIVVCVSATLLSLILVSYFFRSNNQNLL